MNYDTLGVHILLLLCEELNVAKVFRNVNLSVIVGGEMILVQMEQYENLE